MCVCVSVCLCVCVSVCVFARHPVTVTTCLACRIFGLMLFMFESRTKSCSEAVIRRYFGFMFSFVGRTGFLLLYVACSLMCACSCACALVCMCVCACVCVCARALVSSSSSSSSSSLSCVAPCLLAQRRSHQLRHDQRLQLQGTGSPCGHHCWRVHYFECLLQLLYPDDAPCVQGSAERGAWWEEARRALQGCESPRSLPCVSALAPLHVLAPLVVLVLPFVTASLRLCSCRWLCSCFRSRLHCDSVRGCDRDRAAACARASLRDCNSARVARLFATVLVPLASQEVLAYMRAHPEIAREMGVAVVPAGTAMAVRPKAVQPRRDIEYATSDEGLAVPVAHPVAPAPKPGAARGATAAVPARAPAKDSKHSDGAWVARPLRRSPSMGCSSSHIHTHARVHMYSTHALACWCCVTSAAV